MAEQVQRVRGLRFTAPVSPEPVTRERINELLYEGLNHSFPRKMTAAEGRAWSTIGAIPQGADLRQSILDYAGSQFIGFYDPATDQLVFIGSDEPTPYERVTLAHELTHALQDQRFDLDRLNRLESRCQDEPLEAFSALVEGDATETSVEWAGRFLSADEIQQFQQEAGSYPPPPASVPPFVQQLLVAPYVDGRTFVVTLQSRGGESAVNAALRNPPVSTEQVLHPDKYPRDVPEPVAVPNLARALGPGWRLLDIGDIGELWLRTLLGLRLDSTDAAAAAAGWDGSRYRAWGRGTATAVVMETTWDSVHEASQFAGAMEEFLAGRPGEVRQRGADVEVLFGSDPATLAALEAAAG